MHLCARRLADDQDSRRRTDLHDRARPEREMRVAGAASAHGSQQALERSMDLDGRSLDDLDRVRFHNWRAWGVGTAIACRRQRPCACLWHCLPLPEVECTLRINTITQCDLIAIGRCFLVSHDSEPSTKSAPHSIRRLSDLEIKAFAKRMKVPAWLCRGGRRGSSSTAR